MMTRHKWLPVDSEVRMNLEIRIDNFDSCHVPLIARRGICISTAPTPEPVLNTLSRLQGHHYSLYNRSYMLTVERKISRFSVLQTILYRLVCFCQELVLADSWLLGDACNGVIILTRSIAGLPLQRYSTVPFRL